METDSRPDKMLNRSLPSTIPFCVKEKIGKEERPVILRIAMNNVDYGTFSLDVGLLWIAHLYYHKGALSGKHTGHGNFSV